MAIKAVTKTIKDNNNRKIIFDILYKFKVVLKNNLLNCQFFFTGFLFQILLIKIAGIIAKINAVKMGTYFMLSTPKYIYKA